MEGDSLGLLDTVVDSGHRSFLLGVKREQLQVLVSRPPSEYLRIDECWVERYKTVNFFE